MFLIGHRGAAGLAPENTLLSIEAGIDNGANAIECDIRVTKDKKLVLCHDDTLLRIAGNSKKISELSLNQIHTTITNSGQPIPTLAEALEAAGNTPLVIEGKGSDWAELLATELKGHKGTKPMVISSNHPELFLFTQALPGVETFAINDHSPFDAIRNATLLNLSGISTGFSHYNPLVYRYARRNNLKMITSPINRPWAVWFFHKLYPEVMITTDFPDRFKK